MKFVTFTSASNLVQTPGILINQNEVVDLSGLGYRSLLALIEDGAKGLEGAKTAVATGPRLSLAEVTLHAPIPRPPRIFGIGLNYQSHAAESKMAVQKVPTVFLKLSSSVVGPDAPIVLPKISTQPDYEAELGFVIGKSGYQISAASAMEHVFGYTIVNDVSARDIQLATSQWTLGKSFPGFTPIGPAITTVDEVADPHSLDISLTIDGETLQNANTRDLIFKIPALIEYLSSTTPLEAGDIISTGTPEGVGLGRTPQRWLKPNEEIVITIAGLGELRNRTVDE
ncbi:fumarylacetoacetate hydrolase family protein [Granulicella arctica]|uniref:2-keto-4-pentenoate hydratase/2-oxohepta-3-ene-1,7-dioic acid hydratase in catechol pathway n=1 Tax=Granulicella arctica TaxID=940613 RepID=A0A7Y9THN1_9BACT|nr:fumarylacetoacetate hydrolase family protein [Granulicella arctica]NYF80739.1 2-keto-4-pentenoate hydratase/2-oxohepta-3-ene-1,7-dioic acid hydratase in catechol pathway [Granulicella arctica]